VVPDCLRAQVKLGSDLLRRAALLQKTKYLDLTRGEMRGRRSGCVVRASFDQPEDATTVSPLLSCTELHWHPRPGGGDEVAGRFAGRGGAEHLLRESVAGTGPVLGCYDGGELATANVAEEALGCRIDPADDAGCVEDVRRYADALQGMLNVAADSQSRGHHGSVADRRSDVLGRLPRCPFSAPLECVQQCEQCFLPAGTWFAGIVL
jgi:hypothetical protein